MSSVTLPNNWEPRPQQLPALQAFDGGIKRHVWVWHRRFGKDDVALNLAAREAFKRVGEYWHMLPEAAQSRKAIWEAVNPHTGKRRIDQAFPLGIRENYRDSDMMIRFKNGSLWRVVGSDNFDSLVGTPPIGIVFSEYALADPRAWDMLRPILAENNGWAVFISTPRGKNHFFRLYEYAKANPSDWFAQKLSADDTKLFSQEVLDRELAELQAEHGIDVGQAIFDQEYQCSFVAPVVGSYYGKEMIKAEAENRVCGVPYDPRVEVETWWDLGVGDATAIWFCQRVNAEIRLIDYIEATGQGLAFYIKALRERPYIYGRHVAPHDIEHRELGSGRTRLEMARELGIEFVVAPKVPVDDGINAVRAILPRCWFDAEKCKRGVQALTNYRAEFDAKRDAVKSYPLHDWASHGADAFRYGAVTADPKPKTTKLTYSNKGII